MSKVGQDYLNHQITKPSTGGHDGDVGTDQRGHEEQGRRLQGEEQAHRRDPGADGAHRGPLPGKDLHEEGRGEARDPGMSTVKFACHKVLYMSVISCFC